jgi:hypothetical protein
METLEWLLLSKYLLAEHETLLLRITGLAQNWLILCPADKKVVMESWLKAVKENACKPERLLL